MKIPPKKDECVVQPPPQQNHDTDGSRAENEMPNEEAPEMLLRALVEAVQKLCAYISLAFSFVMVDLGGYKFLDRLIQWSVRNPHKAICIVAGLLIFLLPFMLLLGIGISTLLMTLTGFIVLEGIILSMIATLLLGCVGALCLMVFFMKQLHRTA